MDTAKLQMSAEMETLRTKLKATWVSGDFGKSAESFTSGGADFVGSGANGAVRDGDAILPEQLLGLELVNIHKM
jgi:hypothetical protein